MRNKSPPSNLNIETNPSYFCQHFAENQKIFVGDGQGEQFDGESDRSCQVRESGSSRETERGEEGKSISFLFYCEGVCVRVRLYTPKEFRTCARGMNKKGGGNDWNGNKSYSEVK